MHSCHTHSISLSNVYMHMEYSRQLHPHLTCAGAGALLLATVVLQMQVAVVRPAPAAPATAVGGDGMHHLHFFMHDGYPTATLISNGTAAPVLPGTGNRLFGDTTVIDDVLTEGPSRSSRVVGRAQGTYVLASLDVDRPAFLMSVNLVLTDYDGYAGSTVALMGRNHVTDPVRELSVVGGTGRFRMATGYVIWKTASWRRTNNAVLELDVFLRIA